MSPIVRAIASFASALLFATTTVFASGPPRVALVIGNSSYASAPLATAAYDARSMAQTLQQLGFTIIEATDADRGQMLAALERMRDAMQGGGKVGLFYFAGHGLQLGQRNYLLPVDAKPNTPSDVLTQTIDIRQIFEAYASSGNIANIFILDACREHPFGAAASGRGLAQMEAPVGSFVALAATPGEVAVDRSSSREGLYTRLLREEIVRPSAKIEDVFKRVRFQVRKQTQDRQLPWETTSLEADLRFDVSVPGANESASPTMVMTAGTSNTNAASMVSSFAIGNARLVGDFQPDRDGKTYSGTGRLEWSNGAVFDGTLVAGKREGHGRFDWGNGQRYEGQWKGDLPNGRGVIWFANGDVFEGAVRNGMPDGQGRMRFASGDRYVGEFRVGLLHGRGAYTWVTGQTMVGEWFESRVRGTATIRFVNGDIYEGEVHLGLPEGRGRIVFLSGEIYTGEFKVGQPEGEGTYQWLNGDQFIGQWRDGKREGYGVLTFNNGERWQGIFRADARTSGEVVPAPN